MASLVDTLQQVMDGYAGEGINGRGYLTRSLDGKIYTVAYLFTIHGERRAGTGLFVRLQDDKIIVEHDSNNKPLVDALVQAGVPREQIVLAYAGEAAETASCACDAVKAV